jgi:predicted lipoprotein with Yx(FWY)xxD motif
MSTSQNPYGQVKRWGVVGPLALAGALVLAACGGSTKAATPGSPSSSPATTGSAVVELRNIPGFGSALTTAAGKALYTYTADSAGMSTCTGACLQFWPALLVPAGSSASLGGAGVTGLATISASGGTQVTFNGMPLYTFVNDTKAAQVTGQNSPVGAGKFELAVPSAAGSSATAPASTVPAQPATTTAPSGGGYGY